MITEINLDELIDQIIACVINHNSRDKNKKAKFLNADSKINADDKINNSKLKSNSNLNQSGQADQVNINKLKFSNDKEKQPNNNQSNNNVNNNQSNSGRQLN